MSGTIGDKQWEEFMRIRVEYIERFGEVDFTTMDMELDDVISIFKECLFSGEPRHDDNLPEGVLL